MRNQIIFYINGIRHSIGDERAGMMLAEYLRYELSLTGTKIVCAEGDCGACTVLRYYPADEYSTEGKTYYAINSCITPVATLDGSSLITVDALADSSGLHEVQRSMAECHGSQCGFCTPGFVMAMTGLVEKKLSKSEDVIEEQEAKNALTGNLCRCTGYDAILDSAKNIDLTKCTGLKDKFYSKKQEIDLLNNSRKEVVIQSANFNFYAPKNLLGACQYLDKHKDVKIIASSTDLGVVHNKRKSKLTNLLSLHLIDELYAINEVDNEILLGARVTLTELRHFLKSRINNFATYLDIFASPQIKNIATVVGNVANASPIGDTPPALLALGAKIHLQSSKGKRTIPLDQFFIDYRKTALLSNEIITSISFPSPGTAYFNSFKNSNRKDLDISAVNLSVYIDSEQNNIRIAAGGVAAIPLRFTKTEEYLINNKISDKTISRAVEILHTEFTPLSDVRASAAYRHILIENFFKRGISEYRGSLS